MRHQILAVAALSSVTSAAHAQGPAPPPGVVRLHVDSPAPAEVIEHLGVIDTRYGTALITVTEGIRRVCVTPCDRIVDGSRRQPFELTSPAFPDPPLFGLAGLNGDVTLTVTPGSNARRAGGRWLTVLGGTATFIGAISVPITFTKGVDSSPGFRAVSVTMLVAGSAILAGGLALLFTSGTKIRLEQRGAPAGMPLARAPRLWMGEF